MTRASVFEVFKTQGQPTVTYVSRQNGQYEEKLRQAIDSKGLVCLLTGPSKTGKTSLYTKVLAERHLEPLRVRCNVGLTATELWRKALEQVNFDRISQLQEQNQRTQKAEGKIGGSIGWAWLAGFVGGVSAEVGRSSTDADIRERILAEPSPEHLVPILKELPYFLVVEDFHYLKGDVQRTVFQQWKVFVDEEVTVLVVGTTHHAADLAHANKDLVGRVQQIDLTTWKDADLARIAEEGFRYLRVKPASHVCGTVASESVGLPIITQAVCLQLLLNTHITEGRDQETDVSWTRSDVYSALHKVATDRFQGFEAIYDRLTRGPRKRARRFDTYELVLSAFTLDPLVFSLKREEMFDRLGKLPIPPEQIPPAGSLASTFNALGNFQERLGVEILEWSARDQRLYILEPAFLFFLRWRKQRTTAPSLHDMLIDLIGAIRFDAAALRNVKIAFPAHPPKPK